MTNTDISNYDDLIDSRQVIDRIEELTDQLEGGPLDAGDAAELKALQALASEAEGYADDWEYGETLVRDSYFKKYAQELADDIGAIDNDAKWPQNCIDWDHAARELKYDYTAVGFDGVTYWIR